MVENERYRVAVVDDDHAHNDFVSAALRAAGYSTTVYSSPIDFLNSIRKQVFDVVLLDWNMPEIEGPGVLIKIRKELPDLPVMMLTCRTDDDAILACFDCGANDFVTKPVSPPVLVSRIKAFLNRFAEPDLRSIQPFRIGRYEFDPLKSTVSYKETTKFLTNQEFSLARLLFSNPNRPLSRKYIYERVWGRNANVNTRTIDTHIARLRVKLSLSLANGARINTIYGYGYRLEFLVE